MKSLKFLLCLIVAVTTLTLSGCSSDDEASGLNGWWVQREVDDCYCFIHFNGNNFNYYHYATKGKSDMIDKPVNGKSGWYCQHADHCIFVVQDDYLILDNGKKAIFNGNTIEYYNRTFRRE